MKIVDYKIFIVDNPAPHFGGRYWILLKLTTDNGLSGIGEAYYCQIAPHLYCSPIEGAANIQLDVCSPNFLIQEGILNWGGFHAEILKKPIFWQEGYIIPTSEPGLGIELNEEVVANHPYLGEELHLEMINKPIH